MSYESGLDARIEGRPARGRRRQSLESTTKGLLVNTTCDRPGDRLTPRNCTVILIDHQVGPLWEPELTPTRRSVTDLARVAKLVHIPTIITSQSIDTKGGIISELLRHQPSACYIARACSNPWDDPRVQSSVKGTGRRTLLLSGTAADVSVTSCALAATDAGFLVYVLVDASSGFSLRSIARLSMTGVIVTTTALVITELRQ